MACQAVDDGSMLPRPTQNVRLRPLLALGDGAAILLAIYLGHLIRFSSSHFASKWGVLLENPGLLGWAVFSCWILAAAAELYEPHLFHQAWEVSIRVTVVLVVWSAGMILASYTKPDWVYGRGLLFLTVLVAWPLLLLDRRVVALWLGQRRRAPALVVGTGDAVKAFCRDLAERPGAPWKPIDGSGFAAEEIHDHIEALDARLIIVVESNGSTPPLNLPALHFSGVPVVAAVDLWAWLDERLPLETLSPELVLHQPGLGAVHWNSLHRLTRYVDFALAALLLVATSPVLVVAMALVALVDGLPVFYRQERLGQFGRAFKIWKLRTMRRDAEPSGPRFATERDPRVSRLGAVLRRLRIDELPQLLNVLRGEMAIVGPRPERPSFSARLASQIPFYSFRLAVRPGITGWAQINTSYARDLKGHRRKLEFDLYYIRESSLRLYLLTLLRTLSAMIAGNRRPAESVPGPGPLQERLEPGDDARQGVVSADPLPAEPPLAVGGSPAAGSPAAGSPAAGSPAAKKP